MHQRHQWVTGLVLVAAGWILPTQFSALAWAQRSQRGTVQQGESRQGESSSRWNRGQGGSERGDERGDARGSDARGSDSRGSDSRGGENQDRGRFQRGGSFRRGGSEDSAGAPGGQGERGTESQESGRGEGRGSDRAPGRGGRFSGRDSRGSADEQTDAANRETGGRGEERGRRSRGRGGDDEQRDEREQESERGRQRGERGERGERTRRSTVGDIRQQVIDQLKALDLNQNGRLEPAEANPTSVLLMTEVGLDPGQPVYLQTLQSLIKPLNLAEIEFDSQSGIVSEDGGNRFEFSEVRTRSRVADFSAEVNPLLADPTPLEDRYSYQVMAEVRSLMARYDENRNGVLDAAEIALVPWSKPHPNESDLDQNGVLSDVELAERLAAISGQGRASRSRRSRDRGDASETDERAAQRAAAEAERAEQAAERRERERQRKSGGAADRIDTYVRDLLKKWDADGDGEMSVEEAKEMRNPPPKTADSNSDDKFSYAELYGYYGDGESPKSSGGSGRSRAGQASGESSGDSRPPLPGTIRWDGAISAAAENSLEWPSELERKDRNGDGMISLAEFSSNLDESTRATFQRWDANRDGYITRTEAKQNAGSPSARSSSESRAERSGSRTSGRRTRDSADSADSAENARSRSSRSGSTSRRGSGDTAAPRTASTEDTGGDRASSSSTSQRPTNVIRYSLGGK